MRSPPVSVRRVRLLLIGRRPQLMENDPDDLCLPGDLNDEAFVSETREWLSSAMDSKCPALSQR